MGAGGSARRESGVTLAAGGLAGNLLPRGGEAILEFVADSAGSAVERLTFQRPLRMQKRRHALPGA